MKTLLTLLSAVLLAFTAAPVFAQGYSSGHQNQSQQRPEPAPSRDDQPKPIKYGTDVRNQDFNRTPGHRSDYGYRSNYNDNRYQNRQDDYYNKDKRNNGRHHRQNGQHRNDDRRW